MRKPSVDILLLLLVGEAGVKMNRSFCAHEELYPLGKKKKTNLSTLF